MAIAMEEQGLREIADGDDPILAMLARGTLAEMCKREPHSLADPDCAWQVFNRAWEIFTENYDPTRGLKPHTYAHWCILGAITRVIQHPRYRQRRDKVLSLSHVTDALGDKYTFGDMALVRDGSVFRNTKKVGGIPVPEEAERDRDELRAELFEMMKCLHPRTVAAIKMRFIDGMKYKDIAKIDGASRQAVFSRVKLGLAELRGRFAGREARLFGEA